MSKFNSFLVALISIGIGGLVMYFYMNSEQPAFKQHNTSGSKEQKLENVQNNIERNTYEANQPIDLRKAARETVKGVVHVKTLRHTQTYRRNPIMDFIYGYTPQRQIKQIMQAGSGVIISPDGYIITNNHVIKHAEKISVTLSDNRNFIAELIGSDDNTDLALLKIENVSNLDTIPFADSDKVALGEWVLAVGNPFDLTSTVTSGIVSAKARSISKSNRRKLSLEAFIQTDAAVNSGNSGGALVNSNGKLIGINTAIESSTGAYIGYSFAIPSNIVKKVTQDLRKYGEVQRAFLGVQIIPVSNEIASMKGLSKVEGILVVKVFKGKAAQKAGIQEEDIIISVNGIKTNSIEQLQEQIGKYSPNDTISITIKRNGSEREIQLILDGDIKPNSSSTNSFLGANLETVYESEEIKGVRVTQLTDGRLYRAGIRKGFIIQQINNIPVETVDEIQQVLRNNVLRGIFLIDGIYPDGERLSVKLN